MNKRQFTEWYYKHYDVKSGRLGEMVLVCPFYVKIIASKLLSPSIYHELWSMDNIVNPFIDGLKQSLSDPAWIKLSEQIKEMAEQVKKEFAIKSIDETINP